jgi:hypothetical protein
MNHRSVPRTSHSYDHVAPLIVRETNRIALSEHPTHIPNDAESDDEHRVNPLWMITVALAVMFALMLLMFS